MVVVDVFGQLSAAMWQARLVGTPAWRFGPTHVCQGVGCRYCDVSVPGDGRGSRGMGGDGVGVMIYYIRIFKVMANIFLLYIAL